ncbi:peptidase S10 [Klebsiella pneumoniae]|nr:peptidase S10 [Klebsiella pneumoniae]
MKKKTSLSEEDQALFRQLMTGTRKIKQDTIVHRPQRKKITEVAPKRLLQEQVDNSHYFSDEFQPLLNTEGSTKYVRPDVSHFELKKLRRGDYSPELFLDLHGLTQQQAKQELGALIAACRREHVFCACVMARARETHPQTANPAVAGATSAYYGVSPGTKRVRR